MPEHVPPSAGPQTESIRRVLAKRAQMEGYPLSAEDVAKHADLLITLIRQKIATLAGFDDDTPMTIVEALNHVLMSQPWNSRDK